ncbi:MAG: hypothetical protein NWE92_03160 [Candidatus Bathyarchaeota archaeon]|nr:hypothetical protein [Candidatus Bathyarchaeota archaeon]
MKRLFIVVVLVLILIVSVISLTQIVSVAQAQSDSHIQIQSPQSRTYTTNSVALNIYASDGSAAIVGVAYQLDGQPEVTVYTRNPPPVLGDFSHMATVNATLTNLQDGPHHLRVLATWTWWTPGYGYQKTFEDLNFTVAANVHLSLNSPLNRTYNTDMVPLTVTANNEVSLTYSLDGEAPVDFLANTTLSGLSEGGHSLKVTAADATGNSAIRSVNFAVDTQGPVFSDCSVTVNVQNVTEGALHFVVDDSISWIGYCLDGAANVTITGNSTLTNLQGGLHKVTLYANDTAGNMGVSTDILFSNFDWFLIILVAILLLVSAFGAALFIALRKRQRASA